METVISESTNVPDGLIAGTHGPVTIPVTIASGQKLVRGTVLGRITTGGKYSAYDNDNVDGTGVAIAVLGKDTDATAGDEASFAIVHGEVAEAALTGCDAAALLDLQAVGIYVR